MSWIIVGVGAVAGAGAGYFGTSKKNKKDRWKNAGLGALGGATLGAGGAALAGGSSAAGAGGALAGQTAAFNTATTGIAGQSALSSTALAGEASAAGAAAAPSLTAGGSLYTGAAAPTGMLANLSKNPMVKSVGNDMLSNMINGEKEQPVIPAQIDNNPMGSYTGGAAPSIAYALPYAQTQDARRYRNGLMV